MDKMEDSTVASLPKELEFSELPDEVLLKIMVHLNDTTLLNITRVCKRFQAIAKDAFGKKYNGKSTNSYFKVKFFHENLIVERKKYQPLFYMFGERMVAIDIKFDDGPVARDHWIFAVIRRFCTKLSKMKMHDGDDVDLLKMFHSLPMTKLKHLKLDHLHIAETQWSEYWHPNLIRFQAVDLYEHVQIINFIRTNNQLREIQLKHLEIDNFLPFIETIENNCKNIRKLELIESTGHILWNSEMISILCKLTTLNWLKIHANTLKLSQLESCVRRLTNLSTLNLDHITASSEIYENLSRAISICQHVPKLTIRTEDVDFTKFSSELLNQIADKIMDENKTVVLIDENDVIAILKGEVRRNGTIVYNQNAVYSKSTTKFLDLNEKCLANIIKYLGPKQHCALHDTCKKTRKAIKEYYTRKDFSVELTPEDLSESIMCCLGKHIQFMVIHHKDDLTKNVLDELWRRINQNCINLKGMAIINITDGIADNYIFPLDCVWPKLEVLFFSSPFFTNTSSSSYAIHYETLRSLFCPILNQLGVICLKIDDQTVRNMDHGDHFRHLKVLKFGYYNGCVNKFLLALNDDICEQMDGIFIGSQLNMTTSNASETFDSIPFRFIVELISIVQRFRNLTTLHLIVPGVDLCNTKYLFEKCTKLVDFGIWCSGKHSSDELLEHILDNCLQIGTIRLFGYGIYEVFVKKVRQMFPNVTVECTIPYNILYPA